MGTHFVFFVFSDARNHWQRLFSNTKNTKSVP